jgi:hypothetical protein
VAVRRRRVTYLCSRSRSWWLKWAGGRLACVSRSSCGGDGQPESLARSSRTGCGIHAVQLLWVARRLVIRARLFVRGRHAYEWGVNQAKQGPEVQVMKPF